ncbi:hypothetical protein vseg_013979 [Gypsophila vaccaria]
METLLAVAHHRNQYYSNQYYGGGCRKGSSSSSPVRFGPLLSNGFTGVNCRAFEAGVGLLPSPCMGYVSPVSSRRFLARKPQVPCGGGISRSEGVKKSKRIVKSSPIAIQFEGGCGGVKGRELRDGVSSLERWAGPAYSNSPPPSSLPMPKFDMKPKRTVSLELSAFESDLKLPPMSKSAPTTPTSKCSRSSADFFSDGDSATKTLRRILNLDVVDD